MQPAQKPGWNRTVGLHTAVLASVPAWEGRVSSDVLVSYRFQQGKGGGGLERGESFGQSSSKKTEQLETAGCNFSDP